MNNESETSSPISDSLIGRIATVLLPVTHYRVIATDALGLTEEQLDAQCTSSDMIIDPIYRCLRLAVERKRINTPAELADILDRASRNDVISRDAVTYLGELLSSLSYSVI